jgi:hypothetical protein
VVAAVKHNLAHPDIQSEIRKTMAADVFYAPGSAADRVASVVLYATGLEASLPADVMVLEPDPEAVRYSSLTKDGDPKGIEG